MFYGWWLVVVGVIAQAVSAGGVSYAYSVLVTPLEHEFNATRLAMMWGMTACVLVGGVTSPWLGSLADRQPIRRLMAAGVLSIATGFVVLSFTSAVWQVALCFALFMSFGQVLLSALTVSTLLARWFSRRRGLAFGLAAVGTGVGGFLFPPLLQSLIAAFGWRIACRWLAVIILAGTLPPVWLLVVNRPSDKGLHPDGADTPLPGSEALPSTPGQLTAAAVLRRGDFWVIAAAVGVVFASTSALIANLVPYGLGQGLTAPQATALLSIIAAAAVLGKLLFGAVADRIDLRLALAVCMACMCLAVALFRTAHSLWLMQCGSFMLGIAAGGTLPLWSAILGQAFGARDFGRVMGLMSPVMMPLILISSPLAGGIFDATGDYRRVFEVFFVALVLAALPLARLRPLGSEGW
jgi:MFS family permease